MVIALAMDSSKEQDEEDYFNSNRLYGVSMAMAMSFYMYLREKPFKKFNSSSDRTIDRFEDSESIEVFKKLLLFLPKSGNAPITHDCMEFRTNVGTVTEDYAGILSRKYFVPIYKFLGAMRGRSSRQAPNFIPESPNCLHTFYCCTPLPQEAKAEVYSKFSELLTLLLKTDDSCNGLYDIISYNDEGLEAEDLARILEDHFSEGTRSDAGNLSLDSDLDYFSCDLNFSHLGFGQATIYYYNYICKIATDLPARMAKWRFQQGCVLCTKVYIVVPYSCNVPARFDNQQMEPCTPLEDHVENVGLAKQRPFQNSVWKFSKDVTECQTGQDVPLYKKRFVVEYASSIERLENMRRAHSDFHLRKSDMLKACQEFVDTFLGLLAKNPQHESLFEIVYFDDRKESLYDVLRTRIEEADYV